MITDTKTGILHIMLDLETWDTKETAAILSMGATSFDLDNFTVLNNFYMNVGLGSCLVRGLTVDQATIDWWKAQNTHAKYEIDACGESLPSALTAFSEWVRPDTDHGPERDLIIWGNGSTFDNMILRNAYRACGLTYPVSYKGDLCYRTMRRVFDIEKIEEGVSHNALSDARNQAQSLINFFKAMKEKQ